MSVRHSATWEGKEDPELGCSSLPRLASLLRFGCSLLVLYVLSTSCPLGSVLHVWLEVGRRWSRVCPGGLGGVASVWVGGSPGDWDAEDSTTESKRRRFVLSLCKRATWTEDRVKTIKGFPPSTSHVRGESRAWEARATRYMRLGWDEGPVGGRRVKGPGVGGALVGTDDVRGPGSRRGRGPGGAGGGGSLGEPAVPAQRLSLFHELLPPRPRPGWT